MVAQILYLSEIVASFLQRTTSCEASLHQSATEQSYNIIHGWDGVTVSAAKGGAISLKCKSGALALIPTHTVIDAKTGNSGSPTRSVTLNSNIDRRCLF